MAQGFAAKASLTVVGQPTVTRTQIGVATGSLADGATDSTQRPAIGKSGALVLVQTDFAARIRMYDTASARTADLSRGIQQVPAPGIGLLAEIITEAGTLDMPIAPVLMYANAEEPVVDNIPISVTNLSGATRAINVVFTVIIGWNELVALEAHTHAASDIVSGILATTREGSGTPDATKVLVGDGSWEVLNTLLTALLGSAAYANSADFDAAGAAAAVQSYADSHLGGRSLSMSAPANGDAVVWDNALATWKPAGNNTNAYCVVHLGSPQTVGSNAFNTINLDTKDSDPGNNFNTTTHIYTVPTSGYYRIATILRIADNTPSGISYGHGVHTSNMDGAWFLWTSTVSSTGANARNGQLNERFAHFTAGAQIRMYAYIDNASSRVVSDASMAIELVAAD